MPQRPKQAATPAKPTHILQFLSALSPPGFKGCNVCQQLLLRADLPTGYLVAMLMVDEIVPSASQYNKVHIRRLMP